MSYVAEWRGGGPHDLLRGFDSFRNCFEIVFMATMVRPKAGWCFYTALFFMALHGAASAALQGAVRQRSPLPHSASGRCFSSE